MEYGKPLEGTQLDQADAPQTDADARDAVAADFTALERELSELCERDRELGLQVVGLRAEIDTVLAIVRAQTPNGTALEKEATTQ